ncbi:U4/U6 small nuclear ribonucleoprotein Prp31 homolog [Nicotiana tabacum]|uniref:U4/U6 small nuclear ribonucleoprotein Prp31 homolog n=1 Tax=Nicotiana tabacum TaxID=4097 RepID=UPI003F4EA92D
MATGDASFLDDLDGLSDHEKNLLRAALNYDDLDNSFKLRKSRRYILMMQKVEAALIESDDKPKSGGVDDPEYDQQLIIDCTVLSVDIENEIALIHNFIRDKYQLRVPELESLVHHPIDYARAVKKIGQERDITTLASDLEGFLPSAIITVFSCWRLGKIIEACDRVLALDSAKEKLVHFVQSRIGYIAPNLSAVVGNAVAAKLMATAGGLWSLSKMRVSDVLYLGAKTTKNSSDQFWGVGTYIEQSEIIQTTPPPPALRFRAYGMLAIKSKLAARVDSTGRHHTGEYGTSLREDLRKKIKNCFDSVCQHELLSYLFF